MRKILIHEFITLDGVVQAPGGEDEDTEGGFKYGGWTMPYWDDEIGKKFFGLMNDVDTFLLGRKTWEIHGAAFEPMPDDDPFGGVMNSKKKVVVSTTLKSGDSWRNSTLIKNNVVEEITKLKKKAGKDIIIDGSSVLAHTLIENDLIDEFLLHVYPISLGGGKRLFPEGKKVSLELLESKPLSTGVVFQHYKLSKAKKAKNG